MGHSSQKALKMQALNESSLKFRTAYPGTLDILKKPSPHSFSFVSFSPSSLHFEPSLSITSNAALLWYF